MANEAPHAADRQDEGAVDGVREALLGLLRMLARQVVRRLDERSGQTDPQEKREAKGPEVLRHHL